MRKYSKQKDRRDLECIGQRGGSVGRARQEWGVLPGFGFADLLHADSESPPPGPLGETLRYSVIFLKLPTN